MMFSGNYMKETKDSKYRYDCCDLWILGTV